MKVLFITRKYPPQVGGMEQFSHGLITSLDCDKEVISLNKSQKHLIWWYPLALIRAIFKLRKVDMVHIGDGVLARMGRCLKFFTKKPVVITVHGLDVVWPKKWYQKFFVSKLKKLDKIFCVSEHTKQECKKRGVPEKKLAVIPNGVFPKKFESEEKFDFGDKKVLLTVGRLVPRKGVFWFIKEVVPKLSPEYLYLVAGTGEQQKEISKYVKEHALADQVRMMGYVPDENLGKLLNSADIFVMPNIKVEGDREGFGIVALEAGSQGLPVIGANIEGIKDAIQDGKNGYLVESGKPEAFIKKIDSLSKREDLDDIKEGIKKYTREHYSWSIISKEYLEEFKRLIDNR